MIEQITQDEIDFFLKNGKRVSELQGCKFESLIYSSFGMVKERLPELLKTGQADLIIIEMLKDRGVNVFHSDLQSYSLNTVLGFVCWIKDELKGIALLEEEYLATEPDIDLMAAGINELNTFGILNAIDRLAGGDILKWKKVKKLPYHMVFDKMYKDSVEVNIQKKLEAIRRTKSKGSTLG